MQDAGCRMQDAGYWMQDIATDGLAAKRRKMTRKGTGNDAGRWAQDAVRHEFIKVFYYDYNYYLKGAMSSLIDDTSGIIRIPHFNKISKPTNKGAE